MIHEILESSFTTASNLEKIKRNAESAYGDALRFNSKLDAKYPTYDDKIEAIDKFRQDIAPIKDEDKIAKIFKKYSIMSRR